MLFKGNGVAYFDDATLADENTTNLVSRMSSLSVGRNPRSMKRLTNILSLIKIFNSVSPYAAEENSEKFEKVMNFGLICLQLAFPRVYQILVSEPDFQQWNEAKAEQMNLEEIPEEVKARLESMETFDEEWEQFLYRYCQREPHLQANADNISQLLNLIKKQRPVDAKRSLPEILEGLLALSSVTQVEINSGKGASVRKGNKVFLSGMDARADNKRDEGFDESGLIITQKLHYLIKSMAQDTGIPLEIRYTSMMNFVIPTRRKGVVSTWNTKGGKLNVVVRLPAHAGAAIFPEGRAKIGKNDDEIKLLIENDQYFEAMKSMFMEVIKTALELKD